MIELLDREQILKLNQTFAAFILEWQNAQYNPLLEENRYEAGQMYDLEIEASRYYSQEECDHINKERFEEYKKKKDNIDTISLHDKYLGQIIYNFPQAHVDDYVEDLSSGIVTLSTELDWKSVICLLDYSVPWLYQVNDYEPVKKALDYLRNIGVNEEFVGGFKAEGQDLKHFLKHLFWIIRCNAALPYCWFSGIDKAFVGDICKHGNLHFYLYSEQQKIEIKSKTIEIGLIEIEDCYENFSDTGAIEGRETIF